MKKTCSEHNRRIVCFGGGSAIPDAVLAGLKKYPVEISSVVSMLESGGSSGQLRTDFFVLPSGDVKKQLLALSNAPQWKKDLFDLRIGREVFDGGHKGHSFGNIFISGLEYIFKDFPKALKIAHEFLETKGEVFPATINKGNIYAVLENGELVFGEDEIDVPKKHNSNLKIKELALTAKIKAFPATLRAIKKADLIIIGPGDLYSSLIPCFLPQGITKAIQSSQAKKVYICNLLRKRGETNDFTLSDFVKEIEKYLKTSLDFVIYNTKKPAPKRLAAYQKEYPEFLGLIKNNVKVKDKKFIGADVLLPKGPISHDSNKLAKILLKLCRQ